MCVSGVIDKRRQDALSSKTRYAIWSKCDADHVSHYQRMYVHTYCNGRHRRSLYSSQSTRRRHSSRILHIWLFSFYWSSILMFIPSLHHPHAEHSQQLPLHLQSVTQQASHFFALTINGILKTSVWLATITPFDLVGEQSSTKRAHSIDPVRLRRELPTFEWNDLSSPSKDDEENQTV